MLHWEEIKSAALACLLNLQLYILDTQKVKESGKAELAPIKGTFRRDLEDD